VVKIHDISIRDKLVLMLVFTSVLVLIVFLMVFIFTDVESYKQRKANSLVGLAHVIGTNSISTIQFQDNDAATQILSELQNVAPEIVHAAIMDRTGKLFALYSKPGADGLTIPDGLKVNKYLFTDKELYVSQQIFDNNVIVGTVFLESDLSELRDIIRTKYELAVPLFFVAIIFSFIVALVVQRYISNRLLALVATMKEVSNTGHYKESIADNGKDEISMLSNVFEDLMKQIMENQRRKDEFIGIASHELKTPLTSIKGYVELLESIEDKQPNKQFARKALENINKLEKLIQDLLDVSKIQSGQLELNLQEFSIRNFLDDTISGFQMISKTHLIERQDQFNGEIIVADRQRIEQVLTNLLSNAIKYSPGEEKVIVHSSTNGAELVIKVTDFGIGIPQEEQANIFERFYRTRDTSIHISGFGLGLYIAKDIISRHNGKIWVESQEKGSAFYFSLPLMIRQAAPDV